MHSYVGSWCKQSQPVKQTCSLALAGAHHSPTNGFLQLDGMSSRDSQLSQQMILRLGRSQDSWNIFSHTYLRGQTVPD